MISNEIFKFFADIIHKASGMVYTEKDFYRLEPRINDMIKIFQLDDAEALYWKYKGDMTPDMQAVLFNVFTNNETYFFRDVRPFMVLTSHILPELWERYPDELIKIWSCASSTGQEALSTLMAIENDMGAKAFQLIDVDATDISKRALEKAKQGVYTGLDVQRGLPIEMLLKNFKRLPSEDWQVLPKLLSKINFREFNLLNDSFPIKKYHIVFCRNVLIYQDFENKNTIVKNIFESLLPGGYMLLGSGESLIKVDSALEKITISGLTVYRKNE